MSTTSFKRQLNPLSCVLLVAIVAIVGYQASAFRPEALPQSAAPMLIATFDLEKTFNALEEKKAADAALQKEADDMKVKTDVEAKTLQQMEKDLGDLQAGTPKHRELMETLTLKSGEYQAQIEFYRLKIDAEKARTMKNIYLAIRAAAERLAQERGYAIVLVDDSIAPIPVGSAEDMMRQISARRMVYTSADVDVSDELISRMNGAYKTAGPAQR